LLLASPSAFDSVAEGTQAFHKEKTHLKSCDFACAGGLVSGIGAGIAKEGSAEGI